MTLRKTRILLLLAILLRGVSAFATNYYINNSTGSDSNSGTSSGSPWATFNNVNSHTFAAGDTINLATGCTWNQQMDLYGAGTSGSPIKVQPYGANSGGNQNTGPMATISRNTASGDICIYLHNPNYWQINGLKLANCDKGIYVHGDNNPQNNNGVQIYKCYFLDCDYNKGEQSTESSAIQAGPNGTIASGNYYLDGLQISCNYFNNCSSAWNIYSSGHLSTPNGIGGQIQNNYDVNQCAQNPLTNGGFLLQDNWFNNCCTASLGAGNTTMLTGYNNNAEFANNVWDVVPNENTYDQTAVDEEADNNGQAYYGNVFYNTAGSAVEILDIHGTGQGETNSYFDGNLFYENGWSSSGMPDAIGFLNNSGDAQTATINNNLYYEPTSGWIYGSTSYVSQSNNLSISNWANVYNAALGFSSTQGANQWSYQFFQPNVGWTQIGSAATNNTTYAWGVTEYGANSTTDGWITQFDERPPSNSNNWIGRVWTAPASGTISIRGFVQSAFIPTIGTTGGVAAQITHWTSPTGGETTIASYTINGGGQKTDYDGILVNAGDLIVFNVNNNGTNQPNNAVSWIPTIYYTSGGGSGGGTTYKIINLNSGLAVDVTGQGTTNGSVVEQYAYNGGGNQQWTLTSLGNGNYKIIGVQSGLALEVAGAGTANGTGIDIYTYTGASNQQWSLTPTSGGNYRLTPANATGSCLDVQHSSLTTAPLELWTYGGGNSQQWALQAP